MEIPLNAQIVCTDGVCGHSEFVLINPVKDQITHLVVKEDEAPNTEYMVPVEFVTETLADTIHLRCSKTELEKMDPFIETTYIREKLPARGFEYGGGTIEMGSSYFMPFVTPEVTVYEHVEDQQIPLGELSVRRGTRVEATDGYVGHVDEFVVNPKNNHITHLVMREGHLWGQKDVIIPLSTLKEMGRTHEDTVFLKINKQQIASLPTFTVNRRWSS